MKEIELSSWPRRPQYELYRDLDFPYFNLTAPVILGNFNHGASAAGSSFTIALVYLLARAANEQPAFRTRIRGEKVVEHEVVHPSITVLAENDRLGFCTIPFQQDFKAFSQRAADMIAEARAQPSLEDPPGADDMLFMTSIPWVQFTGLIHPVPLNPPDSIPRIAWGKAMEEDGRWRMPLSVQCHHAVMDGVHFGRYFDRVQSMLRAPFSELIQ